MSDPITKNRLKSEWESKNPILRSGEFGFEEDTGKLKQGDGVKRWNQLPYVDTPPYTIPRTAGGSSAVIEPAPTSKFDPKTSVYNVKAANTRRLRAALGAARAGAGLCRLTFVGDSLTAGMGGVRGVSDPVSFLRQELTRLGFSTGELVQPHDNPAEPRLNFSPGHWYGTYSFWPFANCSTPGATATLTGIGEVCEVVTAGPSAAFSISIDGGAPYVVPQRADVAGPVVTRVEGLTKGEHTVVVSLVDPGTMYLAAVGFVPSSGVVVQNAGYSGSTTEDWRDEQFGRGRILFQSSNVAPDAIVIELGCNDWNAGVDQATFRSRLDSIVARAQGTGATVLLAVSHFSENGAATWPPYVKTIYDIADARDLALLDLSDRLGYYHERNANGASYDLSSDSTHLTPAGNAVKAEAWLDLLGL